MTLRVLMVTDRLAGGGTERLVAHLSDSLLRTGRVRLAVQHAPGPPAETDDFRAAGVALFPSRSARRYSPSRLALLHRLVCEQDFKLLHSHTTDALRYCLALRVLQPGLRVLHTQHTMVRCRGYPTWGLWQRLLVPWADTVCVVSPSLAKEYAGLGVRRPCLVVPNGIPMGGALPPDAGERQMVRTWLMATQGFVADPQAVWLVSLARLHPLKGQRQLLTLWSHLRPELRARLWLFLLGPESFPGELQLLKRRIEQGPDRERISLLPPTREAAAWWRAADACVSASEYEGHPLVTLEAARCGTPMLLSDIPGHSHVGSGATYFPLPVSREAMGIVDDWLRELVHDPLAARERCWSRTSPIRAQYSLDSMRDAYLRAYQSLLEAAS